MSSVHIGVRWYFYPRPPRGGRPFPQIFCNHSLLISIHALREEGDTENADEEDKEEFISIHALREEGDSMPATTRARSTYFYPRPPRGGRPVLHRLLSRGVNISIHALREEGDLRQHRAGCCQRYFYPRPPRGGRQSTRYTGDLTTWHFYPRPPRGGRPGTRHSGGTLLSNFYPRPPRGGRQL